MEIKLNCGELVIIGKEVIKAHIKNQRKEWRYTYEDSVEVTIMGIKFTAEFYFSNLFDDEPEELGISDVKTDHEDVWVKFEQSDEEMAMFLAKLQMRKSA